MENTKQKKINPTEVMVMMIRKGLRMKYIADNLGVSLATISLTLDGKRKAALARVAEFVQAYENQL